MRTLLLGGTDLTLAVAERMQAAGLGPAGIVYVPQVFDISYRPGLTNSRFADLASWCAKHGITGCQYAGPESIAAHGETCRADFVLAAGWYHMVPASVRARFARGSAGLHGSLLPKLRGGAPLAWAILAGEREAGMTLFELGDGIDDGGIYGQKAFAIGPRTTIAELVKAAESAALALVAECLPAIADGTLHPSPQRGTPTYGLQRGPEDGRIQWRDSAVAIDRLVRAVGRPYPGAFSLLNERVVHVWAAEPLAAPEVHGMPGQIAIVPGISDPCVVTGDGALIIRDASDPKGEPLMPWLRHSGNQRFQG